MRSQAGFRLPGTLLALFLVTRGAAAISVELTEVLDVTEATAYAELVNDNFAGILTRDGSLELNSTYGCTEPDTSINENCGVEYNIEGVAGEATIAAVNIAFHPDSIRTVRVLVDGEYVVDEWEGSAGEEFQAIPGVEGTVGSELIIEGVLEVGEYLGILEVEIYVEVDEVEPLGVSASTRVNISATATTDEASVLYTLDGDAFDESAWTCSSGEVCEITYDFGVVESLDQVRIAFSESTDADGEFSVTAAGESGVFSTVRTGLEAGGRPVGSDDLETYGGVRALARYVKIEATPAIGGIIGMKEVEFRVGEDTPARAVAEKPWLKETGSLPAGREDTSNYDFPVFDSRLASEGGCDSPGVFNGCHIFYIKDGDMSADSRWSCGPTAYGDDTSENWPYKDGMVCAVEFDLNEYRYVRQIQLAFYLGDEQHHEFAVQAYTKAYDWATVLPSAISSGDTVDLQTFDVSVHTDVLRIVPKFKGVAEMVGIKEMVILEKRKSDFVEGTVPVFHLDSSFSQDEGTTEITTRFAFDIPEVGDNYEILFAEATVSALRMKFPKNREFTFDVLYSPDGSDEVSQSFTSAGGEKTFETFTLETSAAISKIEIAAVEGPTFDNKPWYPTLRVVDFQIVGELVKPAGTFEMVSTAITTWAYYNGDGGWGRLPDIIAVASADQELIMTAICETKGATFDGTDCVGDLDDSLVTIRLPAVPNDAGFFVNGPIFLKSGVRLEGSFNVEYTDYSDFWVYEGPNMNSTGEDAVIVIDGAIDVSVEDILFRGWWEGATGSIVPGTVGNLCLEARDSQGLRFDSEMIFTSARSGAARFIDCKNITAFAFWVGEYETGNFLELTRVDDFYISAPPEMSGLLVDSCTNVTFEGAYDTFEIPNPGLYPPTGGDQTSNVVIAGDSSLIVFKNMPVGPGIEPRILMESTEPLVLDDIPEYEDAELGDCIVQVPEGSTEDILIQLNSEQTLTLSGNCWVL